MRYVGPGREEWSADGWIDELIGKRQSWCGRILTVCCAARLERCSARLRSSFAPFPYFLGRTSAANKRGRKHSSESRLLSRSSLHGFCPQPLLLLHLHPWTHRTLVAQWLACVWTPTVKDIYWSLLAARGGGRCTSACQPARPVNSRVKGLDSRRSI